MVQAGTQGIYAEVAERDNGSEWGGDSRWVRGCVASALDTRAHTRVYARIHTHVHAGCTVQTSNKSFNKFCGSGGGADGGGGGDDAGGGNDKL